MNYKELVENFSWKEAGQMKQKIQRYVLRKMNVKQ